MILWNLISIATITALWFLGSLALFLIGGK